MPVVISFKCRTNKISKYIDFHLWSYAQDLELCVKGSTGLIRNNNHVENTAQNSILHSIYLPSLYTNSPHKEEYQQ